MPLEELIPEEQQPTSHREIRHSNALNYVLIIAVAALTGLIIFRGPGYFLLVQFAHACGFGSPPYSNSGPVPHLMTFLGIDTVNGRWYAFWSGFGSDIQEFGIFGLIFLFWRRHNCHELHCLRIGHHELTSTHGHKAHKQLYCHKHIKRHLNGEEPDTRHPPRAP